MESLRRSFFVCRCFYSCNIFLSRYNTHVVYDNTAQFEREYRQHLRLLGCVTDEQFQLVVEEIENEIERRKNIGPNFQQRKRTILQNYKPLHPEIFSLKEKFMSPDFLRIVNLCKGEDCTVENLLKEINQTHAERAYSFPVFTEDFCDKFTEELKHFEDSDCPKGRPNTMNMYGILLNELLEFDENFLTPLREDYLHHITKVLYSDWGGDDLDSHKAFVVKYKVGEDLDLKYHYDNAEVTLNVAVSKTFKGGTLYFGDMRTVTLSDTECTQYEHDFGTGLLHRGQHRHGALPIECGERYNLIIWMRSSRIRNQLCPMCNNKPELVPTVGCGDGFTAEEKIVNVCSVD